MHHPLTYEDQNYNSLEHIPMNKINHVAPRPVVTTLAALQASCSDPRAVPDFDDKELIEFLITGTGRRYPELRHVLEESPILRSRMRHLKLDMLFHPRAEVAELIERWIQRELPAIVNQTHVAATDGDGQASERAPSGSRKKLRMVSISNLSGRCEVPEPLHRASQTRQRRTKGSALKVAADKSILVPVCGGSKPSRSMS